MARVLLLEDDDDLRFTYGEAIKACGCELVSVGTCAEALRTLQVFKPDVLICDLMIGSETSINVANLALYAVPEAEVIFITGTGLFPQGELFQISHNMRWLLRKPVKLRELQDVLLHALGAPGRPDAAARTAVG